MACLETTFLIDLLRKKQDVLALQKYLEVTEKQLTIAAPTIMEIWSGALLGHASSDECELINRLLDTLRVLPLTHETSKIAAEMEVELIRRGQQIQPVDLMIAAIAKAHGEKLVTRDQHYARIPGLHILKY